MRAWILPLAAALATPAFAAPFAPDLAHTSVYFGASHFDRTTMRGRFDKIDGAVNFDEATHQGASISPSMPPPSTRACGCWTAC